MVTQERRHRVEKERLVKDLHDGIGGIATNISLLAEISRRGDSAGMEGGLSSIAELSRELIAELRTFMNTLESNELTWMDLVAEIRSHGTTMLSQHSISFDFDADIDDPDEIIGMFLYFSLLRVTKEAFANIVKHSGAAAVFFHVKISPELCRLDIYDNGRGVEKNRRDGRGLRNMRSRAADLNACLDIISPPGTRICFEVPLPFHYDVNCEGEI
jgi:signal transduction histidine kinase